MESSSNSQSSSSKSKQRAWFGPCKHFCGLRNHLSDDCYSKPKCFTCGSTDHLTKEHSEHVAIKKTLIQLKAQSPLNPTPKKAPRIPIPFSDCKYCGFNNHHSDDYEYYSGCEYIENLNEVRVKELRSDNGTEFRNYKLEEFYDEKCISQNFSSPCTPEQNGVAERINKTLIEAAMPIVRSPDISYFYVFGCPMHIHNHKDHLGKFDEKDDDRFFLGYSPVAKAFRDSGSSEEPPEFIVADDHPAPNELDQPESDDNLESTKIQDNIISEPTVDLKCGLFNSDFSRARRLCGDESETISAEAVCRAYVCDRIACMLRNELNQDIPSSEDHILKGISLYVHFVLPPDVYN
ncbi:retrovirus-related pol polyprotein from transposon TNT 1-94 [Tanacetum coccineum]